MIRVSPNRAEPALPARWRSTACLALLACAVSATPVFAHEGHDHGDGPVVQQQQLAPRLTHASARLEVVALLHGHDLLIYADDYASNAPVPGLRVDVRTSGRLIQALETEPGLCRASLQIEPQEAEVQLEVSLSGEGIAEHFGGRLAVDERAGEAAKTTSGNTLIAATVAGMAALSLLIIGALVLRRRRAA